MLKATHGMDYSSEDSLDNFDNTRRSRQDFTIDHFEELAKTLYGSNASINDNDDLLVEASSFINIDDDKQFKKKKNVIFQDPDSDDNILNDLLTDSSSNDLLNDFNSDYDKQTTAKPNAKISSEKINDLFGDIRRPLGFIESEADNEKFHEPRNFAPRKNTDDKSFINKDWKNSEREVSSARPSSNRTADNTDFDVPVRAIKSAELLNDSTSKPTRVENFFGRNSNEEDIKLQSTVISNSNNNMSLRGPGTSTTMSGSSTSVITGNKEPRRARIPRSNMESIDDPLGLLSGSANQYEDILPMKKEFSHKKEEKSKSESKASFDNLPEWLGGTKKSTPDADKDNKQSGALMTKSREVLMNESRSTTAGAEQKDELPKNSLISVNYPGISVSMDTQQAQEYELKGAEVLAAQTDQLMNCIADNEKIQFHEQDKLFDTLIKRQIHRQATLESQIKLQQTRMNHYIQALARQSLTVNQLPVEHISETIEDMRVDNNSKNDSLQTVQEEKKNLEYMQDILRKKHEKEIEILNTSHETQISFMQESMDKLESRLRQEIEDLQVYYEKKIERILSEKNQLEIDYKEQIDNLKINQAEVIKEIHSRHSENINLLQKEHFETIENITRAKELERESVDFIKTQRTDINNMLENSKYISDDLKILYDDVKNRDVEATIKREQSLKIQTQSLQDLTEKLNKQQDLLNNERKDIVITAGKLQLELNEMAGQFKKNNELLNERETRLEMQQKALMRERELFQEQSAWERQHLQSLKDAWLTDHKEQIKILANEREFLAAEKGKLEVLSHLKSNSHDITRTELEGAIKAAYDAMYEANFERQRWREKSESTEADQKRVEKKERELLQRAKDLEELTQAAIVKREEGMRALREAQRIEKQHKDRWNQLQTQLQLLTERENRVAAEKLTVARERLALKLVNHVEESSEKDMTDAFHITDDNKMMIKEPNYVTPERIPMRFTDVVDPQLLLLRLNLDNKIDIPRIFTNHGIAE